MTFRSWLREHDIELLILAIAILTVLLLLVTHRIGTECWGSAETCANVTAGG